jgi:acyl-CoA-dependent ceramide synthase
MTEPFPPLNGALPPSTGGGIARRRRKSSGLGADVPGDVDVPSFATSRRLDGVNMKSPVELVGWLQALS